MNISSEYSEFSSCSSKVKFEIQLLKWSECDTIGKQIGYIAGRSINTVVSTTINIAERTVKVLHLDDISRYAIKVMKSTCNWAGENIVKPMNSCIKNVAKSIFTQSRLENAAKIYDQGVKKLGSFCKSCYNGLKTLADWTIVPLNKNVLSPLIRKIDSMIDRLFTKLGLYFRRNQEYAPGQGPETKKRMNCNCCKLCIKTLKTISNWTIVPLYNHVISPVGRTLCDIAYGAFSGCFKPKTEDKKKPEPIEDDLNKDYKENIVESR